MHDDELPQCECCGNTDGWVHEYVTLSKWLCDTCGQKVLDEAGCELCSGHSDVEEVLYLDCDDEALLEWHKRRQGIAVPAVVQGVPRSRDDRRRICRACQEAETEVLEEAEAAASEDVDCDKCMVDITCQHCGATITRYETDYLIAHGLPLPAGRTRCADCGGGPWLCITCYKGLSLDDLKKYGVHYDPDCAGAAALLRAGTTGKYDPEPEIIDELLTRGHCEDAVKRLGGGE